MVDKVGLSLDEIIKHNRKSNKKTAATRGRGGKKRGGGRGSSRSAAASRGGKGDASTLNRSRGARRGRGSTRGGRGGRPTEKIGGRVIGGGVQQRKSTRGARPARAARGGRGRGAPTNSITRGGARSKSAIKPAPKSKPGKLMINNLHFNVTDSDMMELFSKFGRVRQASVHYNSMGKSVGTAEVTFENADHAVKAMQEYNNVPLDKRPMKICLIGNQNQIVTIDQRLGPKPKSAAKSPAATPSKRGGQQKRGSGRGATGRGRGRGRGRGGGRGTPQEKLSAEELDKQLDDYISNAEK